MRTISMPVRSASVAVILSSLCAGACDVPTAPGPLTEPSLVGAQDHAQLGSLSPSGPGASSVISLTQTNFQTFTIPAGVRDHRLQLQTGAAPPLRDVRFVAGGSPGVVTSEIASGDGSIVITFEPPAKPFEVTVYFAQNPISQSDSADFLITVSNARATDLPLEVGAIFK